MAELLTDNPNPDPVPASESAPNTEADEPQSAPRPFQELTLGEVLIRLIQQPARTLDALRETLRRPERIGDAIFSPGDVVMVESRPAARTVPPISREAAVVLVASGAAFLIALAGSILLTSVRGQAADQRLWWCGGLMIIGALGMAIIAARSGSFWRLPPLEAARPTWKARSLEDYVVKYGIRIALGFLALIWTFGAWSFNAHNTFTTFGVFCWIMGVGTWFVVLYDGPIQPGKLLNQATRRISGLFTRPITFRLSGTVLALIVILLVGAWLRFSGLGKYPPEMTSDHVEKALDAQRVFEGNRSVFFPNNGGREGFQMYYLAVLKSITGMTVGLEFLQIGTGLEGMVMILLAFWMGRALVEEEDRDLGNLTGLIMAALVATSFWHVLLSRLGLRIVTTTLVTAVVFVFLVRGLRYNRRSDYLIAGLALGIGMYCYQAVRMLPLVVIAGFVLALILRARRRHDVGRYTLNLFALIIISLAVFAPLGRYMVEYPREFWERTTGRLFGEEGLKDPAVAFENFKKNLPELADNLYRSALMFNFRGDMSWFNGAPDGTPELDFFTGALFVLGLGLTGARIVRRRDPADWLLPISILIMLLPAALSLAYSIEVPSLTRASGSLPMVYFMAAFALAYLLRMVAQRLPEQWARRSIYAVAVLFLVAGTLANANSYFVDAMADYRNSTLPHRQAGHALRGFIDSTGAPGNAFLPAFPNWWDYRAVGIEAGDPHWANIIWRDPDLQENFFNLIKANIGTPYEIRPDRQLLFFLPPEDKEFADLLAQWFPNGLTMKVAAYKPSRDYLMYVVPPVGCDWIIGRVGIVPPSCQELPTETPPAPPTPGDAGR